MCAGDGDKMRGLEPGIAPRARSPSAIEGSRFGRPSVTTLLRSVAMRSVPAGWGTLITLMLALADYAHMTCVLNLRDAARAEYRKPPTMPSSDGSMQEMTLLEKRKA